MRHEIRPVFPSFVNLFHETAFPAATPAPSCAADLGARMDNRIGEMIVFSRVVELGGFSAAARAMSMSPSTVSKLIRRLEDRLGLRLFDRSTRALVLTTDGQRYYEAATRLISDLDEAEASASSRSEMSRVAAS